MTRTTLYIFNRKCECIFSDQVDSDPDPKGTREASGAINADEMAKLVFGVVFSLSNMARKLTGRHDGSLLSFSTSAYRLHYLRSPTSFHFVITTTASAPSLQPLLEQILTGPFTDFVIRNPLVNTETEDGTSFAIENDAFRAACSRLLRAI